MIPGKKTRDRAPIDRKLHIAVLVTLGIEEGLFNATETVVCNFSDSYWYSLFFSLIGCNYAFFALFIVPMLVTTIRFACFVSSLLIGFYCY